METSKSFNQEYIEKAKTLIYEILEDKEQLKKKGDIK